MALFVHLAPTSQIAQIRRSGIRRLRRGNSVVPRGLFATPIVQDFWVTHQWLRELKRWTHRAMVGVYFRIPDEQMVWLGHYSGPHQSMTAAEAVAAFARQTEPLGWEAIIPRVISAREIHKIRSLSQVIGWRYSPLSKGRRPCPCRYCTGGEYGSRKLRERLCDPG